MPLNYLLTLCSRNFVDFAQQVVLCHFSLSFVLYLISSCMQAYLRKWREISRLAYDIYRSLIYLFQFISPTFNILLSIQNYQDKYGQHVLCTQIPSGLLASMCKKRPAHFNKDIFIPLSDLRIFRCCDDSKSGESNSSTFVKLFLTNFTF